jgi:hypothetical protein
MSTGPAVLVAQREGTASIPARFNFFMASQDSTAPTPIDPSRVPALQTRIAVGLDGVPLREALWQISQLSGLRFAYANDDIGADRLVHLNARDITVAGALLALFGGSSVQVIFRPGGTAVLARTRNAVIEALRGAVIDSVSRQAIGGAVLMLVDSSGAAVARTLTNERGQYRVALTAASRRVRVARIGFEPRDVPIPDGPVGDRSLDVSMLTLPTLLQPARVVATDRCHRRNCASALGVWEQARAALLAMVAARAANPALMHRLLFSRVLDSDGAQIVSMRVQADSVDSTANSFLAARSAEEFVRFGFTTNLSDTATFFAPDADVLLSDAFARSYEFEFADGSQTRPHQVGLHFTPVDHATGRVEIDGTLWVDTVARELRDVEFRYVGMPFVRALQPKLLNRGQSPAADETFQSGGHIAFRTMLNGVTIIDRWSIHLVRVTADTVVELGNGRIGFDAPIRRRPYVEELGGEIERANWRDGFEWRGSFGTLRVHAVNSAGSPAKGSIIALVATPYFGVVDSAGTAEVANLLPGPYTVRIIDPRIAPLGVGVPTPVAVAAVRDSTTTAMLEVPTAEEYIADRCKAAKQRTAGDSVLMLGRVLTPDGAPVVGARVTIASGERKFSDESTVTGADGIFQSCENWALGDTIRIRVHRSGAPDEDVVRTFDAKLMAVRVTVRSVH